MERRMLLDDLIDQTSACMRDKLKLSLRTVYGQSYGYMKVIQDYCLAHGEKYYNPILLNEFQQELESRYERGEIKQGHYLGKRKCLERLTEYYNTGTLSWTMHKLSQKYRLFDEDKALLEEFLQTLVRDPNTSYDYSWVIRRYLNYLRSIGITDVRTIKTSDLAGFILSCSKEVTRGSLRNILSYTKRFHEFLRDTGRLDISFEGLFSVSVPYIFTDDELIRLFAAIDRISPSAAQPYKQEVLPVMFRLIYTCGLRPAEARTLKTENIYLDSGEVLITGTKRNKAIEKASAGICEIDAGKIDPDTLDDDTLKRLYGLR